MPSAKPLNILFLSPVGQIGGAEVCTLDIIASLRAADPTICIHMIVGDGNGPLKDRAAAAGARVETLPFPQELAALGDSAMGGPAGRVVKMWRVLWFVPSLFRAAFQYASKLRELCSAIQPDVVHSTGMKMHLLSAWRLAGRYRVVLHMHDYLSLRPLASKILGRLAKRCASAICVSKSVAQDFTKVCPGVRTHIVYNAVDLVRFHPKGQIADLNSFDHGDHFSGQRIGLLSTAARWKGQEVFLKALSLLSPGHLFRAYLVGGALYTTKGSQYSEGELKALAKQYGVQSKVVFTGFVDDTAPLLRSLDIVVHASTEREPFGLVIAEAMASGKPIIMSTASGARELIRPGIDALDHPPGDAAALAEGLTKLIADAQLRKTLGSEARKSAEAHFDRSRLGREILPIYLEAMRPAS